MDVHRKFKTVEQLVADYDRWIDEYHNRAHKAINDIGICVTELISNSQILQSAETDGVAINSAQVFGLDVQSALLIEKCRDLFFLLRELKQHALLQGSPERARQAALAAAESVQTVG